MLSAFILIIIASLQFHHVIFTQAFITEHHIRLLHRNSLSSVSSMTPLLAMRNDYEDFFPTDDSDKDYFDIEALRNHYESLVSDTLATGFSGAMPEVQNLVDKEHLSSPVLLLSSTDSLPHREAPPLDMDIPPRSHLTSIERERRSAEIELLGHLTDGEEEVVKEIYNLWSNERGSAAAKLLQQTSELMEQGPKEQDEAESILLALKDECGVYFTEPLNQLATLYYLQGRFEKALQLNKIVLSIKPWHIGALSHIVMVYAAMGDPKTARQWAAFRLPAFASSGSNRKRTRWVERAVVEATARLHQGEKDNALSFGLSDREWITKQGNKYDTNDASAWQ